MARAQWQTYTTWSMALLVANKRALDTGLRYVVRRSHARPRHWLVMQALPVQRLGVQPRGDSNACDRLERCTDDPRCPAVAWCAKAGRGYGR